MDAARVKWIGEERFETVTPSGHTVGFDSDRKSNAGPGPMEMLLAALGSCTATDVVVILAKKRQTLEALEVVVSGERAAEPPRVWTKIDVVYRLKGILEEKAVRDAIDLSESKYCSVAAMLRKTAEISIRYEILPSEKT